MIDKRISVNRQFLNGPDDYTHGSDPFSTVSTPRNEVNGFVVEFILFQEIWVAGGVFVPFSQTIDLISQSKVDAFPCMSVGQKEVISLLNHE